MQAAGCALLHIHELPHCGVLKPWELLERNKELAVSGTQPESMPGYIGHFNTCNTFVAHDEFHLNARR